MSGGGQVQAASLSGRARVFGDDVNSDYIISSRRKRDTVDPRELHRYFMEDIRPGFGASVRVGDVIVAGRNFGCGSAMETASLLIVSSGISAVLAKSFARTFYRNGINGGLLLVETDTGGIEELDRLEVTPEAVRNLDKGWTRPGAGPQGVLKRIVEEGGLLPYIACHGGLDVTPPSP